VGGAEDAGGDGALVGEVGADARLLSD